MTIRCDHWTLPRRQGRRGVWGLNHRCRNPAKYRVIGNVERGGRQSMSAQGETPCGTHVRPYLMDNGDSVWKPWIVVPLEARKG